MYNYFSIEKRSFNSLKNKHKYLKGKGKGTSTGNPRNTAKRRKKEKNIVMQLKVSKTKLYRSIVNKYIKRIK